MLLMQELEVEPPAPTSTHDRGPSSRGTISGPHPDSTTTLHMDCKNVWVWKVGTCDAKLDCKKICIA